MQGLYNTATLTPLERPAQVAASTADAEAGGSSREGRRPTARAARALPSDPTATRRPSAATARPAPRATSAATTTSGSTAATRIIVDRRPAPDVDCRRSAGRPRAADRRPRRASARLPRRRGTDLGSRPENVARPATRGAYDNPEHATARRAVHPGLRLDLRPAHAAGALQQLQADRADARRT